MSGPQNHRCQSSPRTCRRSALLSEKLRQWQICREFLIWLFSQQTPTEKRKASSIDANERGFNQPDAPSLTPLALQALADPAWIPDDLDRIAKKLAKYSGQYLDFLLEGGGAAQ